MSIETSRPTTPCVRICVIDEDSGLCIGCGRNVEEIAMWRDLTEDERLAVMRALPERLDRARARSKQPAKHERTESPRADSPWR